MAQIILNRVDKHANALQYDFSASCELATYFSEKPFVIEYPENIEEVPDAIAVIPFVCNVLPLIWLSDSELVLQELDQAFFDCISNVKKGYEEMYPESVFAGKITVKQVVACDRTSSKRSAVFFSGGLDAVNTLICHLEEKPDLISIWGSDIRFENSEGWARVHNGIAEYAQKFKLNDVVIHSAFREFDNEDALQNKFSEQLKDSWWHGIKHGIGLLGHAAPYAYMKGLSTVYIASSNCPADGPVRCASNPTIDNYVRFADCVVVHDGFEFSRQDKVANLVRYCSEAKDHLSLHVCWESHTGSNCCQCEKCYRTMAGLLAEGADPSDYGFDDASTTIPNMKAVLIGFRQISPSLAKNQWLHIHNRIVDNKDLLKTKPFWKHIQWIERADFLNLKSIKMPLNYRIRHRLSKFTLYQKLSRIKASILR